MTRSSRPHSDNVIADVKQYGPNLLRIANTNSASAQDRLQLMTKIDRLRGVQGRRTSGGLSRKMAAVVLRCAIADREQAMGRLNLWAWVRGTKLSFWGASYRGGVVLVGAATFLFAWLIATYSFGALGFMAGWLPSIILAIIAGFAWPLLAIGGAAFAVATLPEFRDFFKPESWRVDPLVIDSPELAAFRDSICGTLPPPFDPNAGEAHFAPTDTLTAEQKRQRLAYLKDNQSRRAAIESIRLACARVGR